jgi:hypothetical protein
LKSPSLPSERSFGFLFTIVLVLCAGYGYYSAWSLTWIIGIAVAAFLLLVVTLLIPACLRPFNKAWFKLGLLLGNIVSPIILGLIFFLLITPAALIGKFFGRDALRLKKRTENTYWIERDPVGPEPESFKYQF